MDKKPLIVVSIIAVVLLVLGSFNNVAGYQEIKNSKHEIAVVGNSTSTSMKIGGLKLLNMRIKSQPWHYGYLLLLDIQNIGTETIHKISGYAEYSRLLKREDSYSGNFWLSETLEPQETCIVDVFFMPLTMWHRMFFRIYIDVEADVPSYNHLIINDRYCIGADGDYIRPMGILGWLAYLLGL
jgi:hypothetical protein